MDETPPRRRPSVKQLSKTPSWVMLGFILGALFVVALPRKAPPSPRPIVLAAEPEKPVRPLEPPQLTTIEAVFSEWSEYAIWDNDVTQVALWNSAVGDFAEFYEVRRWGDARYFRSLARLTNRIVRHGKMPPPECPLRFTETEEQYREWREHGRYERPPEVVRPVRIPRTVPDTPPPASEIQRAAPPPAEVDKARMVEPKP